MKRNLNESSARSTAGCLPVPLFNQKKRNRQPLTSNPLQNDPGVSTVSDSYGSPSFPTGKYQLLLLIPGEVKILCLNLFNQMLKEAKVPGATEATTEILA